MRRKIDKETKDLIVNLYVESNLKVCEIEAFTNVSSPTIHKILSERDIPRRKNFSYSYRPLIRNKHTNAILNLHKEGKNKSQIARELMISHTTVGNILSKEIKAS